MTRLRQHLFTVMLIPLALASAGIFVAAQRPVPAPPRTLAQVLERIETGAGQFRRSVDQSGVRHWPDCQHDDALDDCVSQLIAATRRLRAEIGRGPRLATGIETLLRLGDRIESFNQRRQLSMQAEQDWQILRGDLEELARVSGTPWEWRTVRQARATPALSDGVPPPRNRKRVPSWLVL